MNNTIIFDMDGLLIDSERFWIEQDVAFFEKRGMPIDSDILEEVKRLLSGNSVREGSKKLIDRFNLDEDLEDVIAERTASTDAIYTHMSVPLPGVEALLDTLKEAGVTMTIGSGSSLDRIEKTVDRFGWEEYFSALVSSDHVDYRGKPAPDIFLYAAEQVGADPATCVVFEDSVNGIEAACHAKMRSIAVPRDMDRAPLYEKASLVVSSLEEQAVYQFLGL